MIECWEEECEVDQETKASSDVQQPRHFGVLSNNGESASNNWRVSQQTMGGFMRQIMAVWSTRTGAGWSTKRSLVI